MNLGHIQRQVNYLGFNFSQSGYSFTCAPMKSAALMRSPRCP
jgi:hypothetical protein